MWSNSKFNFNFLQSYLDNDFHQGRSIDSFIKKYEQVSTYDCHHNVPSQICHDGYTRDYTAMNQNTIKLIYQLTAFYPITPYGSVLCGLGEDFTFHMNHTFFDFISTERKEQIRNENLFILFDYSSEGDIREQVFEKIHEGIEKNNISPNKVIFICSAVNTHEIYESWLSQQEEKPEKIKTS